LSGRIRILGLVFFFICRASKWEKEISDTELLFLCKL
jgi:hypothetical protein